MTPEPIPTERLDAIRRLDLAALMPQSENWQLSTQKTARRWLIQLRPVLHELLNEIRELDLDIECDEREARCLSAQLSAAEEEIERLKRRLGPEPTGVISAIAQERLGQGRYRVRWREDGRQRSRTCRSRSEADFQIDQLIERRRDRR